MISAKFCYICKYLSLKSGTTRRMEVFDAKLSVNKLNIVSRFKCVSRFSSPLRYHKFSVFQTVWWNIKFIYCAALAELFVSCSKSSPRCESCRKIDSYGISSVLIKIVTGIIYTWLWGSRAFNGQIFSTCNYCTVKSREKIILIHFFCLKHWLGCT